MSHSEKLIPCPFCGETPTEFGTDDAGKWGWVQCCIQGPEVRTGYRPLGEWKDRAIAGWNTRKPPAGSKGWKFFPVQWLGHELRRAFQLGAMHKSKEPAALAASKHANSVLALLPEPGQVLAGGRRRKTP